MITITFRAFAFLQEKLKARKTGYYNVPMQLEAGTTVEALVLNLDLALTEVEAVFVNGKVQPMDTVLLDGDRVALVPPGMPGPHRVLMGLYHGKARCEAKFSDRE